MSTPVAMVRLACGSMSMVRTRRPRSASAAATLSVLVVLAVPPFWLKKAMTRAMRLRSHTCEDQDMAGRCCGRCTYATRGYHTTDAKHDDAPDGLPARGMALCGAGACMCAGLSVSWRGVNSVCDASPREYRR